MTLRNGEMRFGIVTRGLHWIIAFGVIGMLGFGTYIARMTVNMSNFHLFTWHKSIGISILLLMIARLAWHRWSPPPAPLPAPHWQTVLARTVHLSLYLLLIAVPLTGWIASSATGIAVEVWGVALPHIAPTSESWETGFFIAHGILTKVLAALVVLHIAGAVKRRDGTLRRILRGTA